MNATRGKGRLVYVVEGEATEYLTLLFPSASYTDRVPLSFRAEGRATLGAWEIFTAKAASAADGLRGDAQVAFTTGGVQFLFGVRRLDAAGASISFERAVDLRAELVPGGGVDLVLLEEAVVEYEILSGGGPALRGPLAPGEVLRLGN